MYDDEVVVEMYSPQQIAAIASTRCDDCGELFINCDCDVKPLELSDGLDDEDDEDDFEDEDDEEDDEA